LNGNGADSSAGEMISAKSGISAQPAGKQGRETGASA
jgi:hypothetical protein